MYIDNITGSLQSLNDTAGNLNRIKAQYEENQLKRAELLNRMGQDETAEKALWDANHSGLLSRLLPNTATGRGTEGAFLEDAPETMQLQSLNPLSDTAQKGHNVLSAFSNAKGGVESLAGLNGELYNGINSDMLNDGGKVIPINAKFKTVKGEQAFKGELGAYDKETADNAQIEADNRKAQAYNESIPQFRQRYEGNEPDQLNQLADDTMAYIKFAEKEGRYQDAAAAYNKYVQTGRAIAQGFQHNFTPLGSEYFFSPKKGGGGTGGEKTEDYHIIVNGKRVDVTGVPRSVMNSKDQNVSLMKLKPDLFKRWGITDPSQFTLEKSSGQSSGRLDDLEQQKLDAENYRLAELKRLENKKKVEGATEGYMSFSQKAKIDDWNEAMRLAGSNERMDYDYNIYYVGKDNRGVVRSTGTGNNAVDSAIGD